MGLIEDLLNRITIDVSAEDVPAICLVLGFIAFILGIFLNILGLPDMGRLSIGAGIILMGLGIVIYVLKNVRG